MGRKDRVARIDSRQQGGLEWTRGLSRVERESQPNHAFVSNHAFELPLKNSFSRAVPGGGVGILTRMSQFFSEKRFY
jgi:hypothetical protein